MSSPFDLMRKTLIRDLYISSRKAAQWHHIDSSVLS